MAPVGGAPPIFLGWEYDVADWELVTDMTGISKEAKHGRYSWYAKKSQCCGPGKWLRLFDATIWYFHDLVWQRESSG